MGPVPKRVTPLGPLSVEIFWICDDQTASNGRPFSVQIAPYIETTRPFRLRELWRASESSRSLAVPIRDDLSGNAAKYFRTCGRARPPRACSCGEKGPQLDATAHEDFSLPRLAAGGGQTWEREERCGRLPLSLRPGSPHEQARGGPESPKANPGLV